MFIFCFFVIVWKKKFLLFKRIFSEQKSLKNNWKMNHRMKNFNQIWNNKMSLIQWFPFQKIDSNSMTSNKKKKNPKWKCIEQKKIEKELTSKKKFRKNKFEMNWNDKRHIKFQIDSIYNANPKKEKKKKKISACLKTAKKKKIK